MVKDFMKQIRHFTIDEELAPMINNCKGVKKE